MDYGAVEKHNGVPGESTQTPDAWAKAAIIEYLLLANDDQIQAKNHDQLMALVCLLALIRVEVGYTAAQQDVTDANLQDDDANNNTAKHDPLAWLRVVAPQPSVEVADGTGTTDTPQVRLSTLLEGRAAIAFTDAEKYASTSNESSKARTESSFKDKIAAMQSLGGSFDGLKADIEKHNEALGWRYYLKASIVWLFVGLYAVGCALAVMGGLLSKFLTVVLGWANMQPLAALLLPAFGVVSFSTFFTNIKIMKADVEDFVDPLFYKSAPKESISWTQWFSSKAWPALKSAGYHALLFLISLITGAVLGLMTWHYTLAWLSGVVASPVAITVAVATFVTEVILTYNLLRDYWAPLLKGLWKKGAFEEDSTWYKVQQKYNKLDSVWRKACFWFGLVLVGAFVIFGLVALSMSGIKAIDEISFMSFVPQVASWVLLGVAVLSQFPMYLAPASHLMCAICGKGSQTSGVSSTQPNLYWQALQKHWMKILASVIGAAGLAAALSYEIAGLAFLSSGVGIAVVAGAGLVMGVTAWLMGKASENGSAFAETLSQNKILWGGYALLGMGGCTVLLSLMTHTAVLALLSSPATGAVIAGAGLLYGTWMLLMMHYKGLPSYVRIASNASGNSSLAETTFVDGFIHVPLVGPMLACVADFFNSFLCGMYGDKDGLEHQDQAIDHAIALYDYKASVTTPRSNAKPMTEDEKTVEALKKHDWGSPKTIAT